MTIIAGQAFDAPRRPAAGGRERRRTSERPPPPERPASASRRQPRSRGCAIGGEAGFRAAHRSEEHTSELQSLMRISYAVFCLKKKTRRNNEKVATKWQRTTHQNRHLYT